jgi:anti-sigma regulatory factor (Ser/Thr protein kinase)
VPLADVVRGAVSEVEDYTRVHVLSLPDAALTGRAVTDLIHLLAELLENATSYSPPHTKVTILGQLVPNGFAIEIEDRGLGMTGKQMAEANARLRQPPEFDPANSARLGLFVVALLAARLSAQVTLRPSPFGGVTAVLLVPPDLIADMPEITVAGQQRVVEAQRMRVGAGGPAPQPRALAAVPTSDSRPQPAPEPSAALPAEPQSSAVDQIELTEDGLPRRVRRPTTPAPEPAPEDDPVQPLSQRPPEQTRAMMSAFQAGLTRGRQDAQAGAEAEQEK